MRISLPGPRHHARAVPILADSRLRLFLTSFTLLFVELVLIRWIPSLVTYVGFFSNFLLMASFLGIGLGILAGRGGMRLAASPFPFLLLGTMALTTAAQLNVQLRSPGEIFFGLAESHAADVNFLVLPLLVMSLGVGASPHVGQAGAMTLHPDRFSQAMVETLHVARDLCIAQVTAILAGLDHLSRAVMQTLHVPHVKTILGGLVRLTGHGS